MPGETRATLTTLSYLSQLLLSIPDISALASPVVALEKFNRYRLNFSNTELALSKTHVSRLEHMTGQGCRASRRRCQDTQAFSCSSLRVPKNSRQAFACRIGPHFGHSLEIRSVAR